MAKRVLNIVETAFRATLEEQDDTALWIVHMLKNAGADADVLLRGNAVNYAVRGQDASGLRFGGWRQSQPPAIDRDVMALAVKGVGVFVVQEDATDRGLQHSDLVEGVNLVDRGGLAKMVSGYDRVWHW